MAVGEDDVDAAGMATDAESAEHVTGAAGLVAGGDGVVASRGRRIVRVGASGNGPAIGGVAVAEDGDGSGAAEAGGEGGCLVPCA